MAAPLHILCIRSYSRPDLWCLPFAFRLPTCQALYISIRTALPYPDSRQKVLTSCNHWRRNWHKYNLTGIPCCPCRWSHLQSRIESDMFRETDLLLLCTRPAHIPAGCNNPALFPLPFPIVPPEGQLLLQLYFYTQYLHGVLGLWLVYSLPESAHSYRIPDNCLSYHLHDPPESYIWSGYVEPLYVSRLAPRRFRRRKSFPFWYPLTIPGTFPLEYFCPLHNSGHNSSHPRIRKTPETDPGEQALGSLSLLTHHPFAVWSR